MKPKHRSLIRAVNTKTTMHIILIYIYFFYQLYRVRLASNIIDDWYHEKNDLYYKVTIHDILKPTLKNYLTLLPPNKKHYE